MHKEPKLSQVQLNSIQNSCIQFSEFSEYKLTFDLKTAIENTFGKKSSSDTKFEVNNVISKLNTDMTNKIETMLYDDLVESGKQTWSMITSLIKTFNLIEESKQFRESQSIQLITHESKEYLDKAKKYYRIASEEFYKIENIPDIDVGQNTLEKITLNLAKAQFECNCARQKFVYIINEIHRITKSLSSNRKTHLLDFVSSVINIFTMISKYINTPKVILTDMAQLLFATNVGLRTVHAVGYATAFLWTDEEIKKLDKYRLEIDESKINIEQSLDTIEDDMKRLKKMKEFDQN